MHAINRAERDRQMDRETETERQTEEWKYRKTERWGYGHKQSDRKKDQSGFSLGL